jgi:UDP-N-acetylglucosamine--N-acetylmuramyl-(pentapeptide) pyrophosphoryl-undecaprenol N-acetylglucosamine transferase
LIIFTCGGTGGHISPSLTLVNYFQTEYFFIGGSRLEKYMLKDYPFIELPYSKKSFFSLIMNTLYSIKKIKKLNPSFVFSTGGYITFPVGIASIILRIPFIILEQNSIPGKANRFLAKFAKIIFTGYQLKNFYPQKSFYTGNPINKSINIQNKNKLLIFGGSQGSKNINDFICEHILEISKLNLDILWITGEKSFQSIKERLDKYTKKNQKIQINNINISLLPFCDNMVDLFQEAKIAISRAGAMSVAELNGNFIPTLYIPFPYATDNHQLYNAKSIVENNAGEMILENEMNKEKFFIKLNKLNNFYLDYKKELEKFPNNASEKIVRILKEKGFLE